MVESHNKLKAAAAFTATVFGVGVSFAAWTGDHPTTQQIRDDREAASNIYDHGYPDKLPDPKPAPPAGIHAALIGQDARLSALEVAAKARARLDAEQWRWIVRYRAADAEPRAALKAQSVRKAVNDFDSMIDRHYEPDEAARRALESMP